MRPETFAAPPRLRPTHFAVQMIVLAILSVLLMAVSLTAWQASKDRKRAEIWYAHTLNVLLETGRLRAGVYAALRGERGYLLTHNVRFLDPYYAGVEQIAVTLREVARLTRDNPVQRRNIHRLSRQTRAYERLLASTVRMEEDGRHNQAIAIVRAGTGKHRIDAVLTTIDRMDRAEKALLAQRRVVVETAMVRTDRYQYSLTGLGVLLVGFAAWAAVSARRAHRDAAIAIAALERLASTDSLTGLANRRTFFSVLTRDQDQAAASALAIIDVDHFKRINDVHGHPAGDYLLQETARILAGAFRKHDIVARIGGEEFAVLMPGTSIVQAEQACERAREAVMAHAAMLGNGDEMRVSISVGLAARPTGASVEAYTKAADAALYRAKAAGRNRVLLAA